MKTIIIPPVYQRFNEQNLSLGQIYCHDGFTVTNGLLSIGFSDNWIKFNASLQHMICNVTGRRYFMVDLQHTLMEHQRNKLELLRKPQFTDFVKLGLKTKFGFSNQAVNTLKLKFLHFNGVTFSSCATACFRFRKEFVLELDEYVRWANADTTE